MGFDYVGFWMVLFDFEMFMLDFGWVCFFWCIYLILDGLLFVRKRDFFFSLFVYLSLLLIGKFLVI